MAENARIVVTGLNLLLTEAQILQELKKFGSIQYIRLQKSKLAASAFVSFASTASAQEARQKLNGGFLYGNRVNVCMGESFPIKHCESNVFIKNIPVEAEVWQVEEAFKPFGKVINSKIAYDSKGVSRGYGFVMLESREKAEEAVAKSGKIEVCGGTVETKLFVPKQERMNGRQNVYVRGFCDEFTHSELVELFSKYGKVESAIICGKKGANFAFVAFSESVSAENAITDLHGKQNMWGLEWYLSKNISRSERVIENQLRLKQNEEKWRRTNLYVKNWPTDLTESQLASIFSKFGIIESVKILTQECLTMYSNNPISETKPTGQAFVCFKDEHSAEAAFNQMKRTLVNNTPLQLFRWVPKTLLYKKQPVKIQFKPKNMAISYFNFEQYQYARPEEKKRMFGEAIYQEIFKKYNKWTGKITGMIIELDESELYSMMENKKILYMKAKEAMQILNSHVLHN